jgi:hypothetical protein
MGADGLRKLAGWKALSGALLLAVLILLASPASAQEIPPPPMPSSIDARGVDLLSGDLIIGNTDLSIGPSDIHGLQLSRQWVGGWRVADVRR